jgi:NAD(P)-dependent dehydrogenase (short-subunit alcohol dehydrogenase family)
MTRGILIAGNTSALFSALENEAAKRVELYTAAAFPRIRPEHAENAEPKARREVLDWNPASPVSARTLVLAAQNKLEHIDEAVLVCSPPAYRKDPAEVSPADIDKLIDDNIKGWFFLAKELLTVFKKRKTGNLSLVLQEINLGPKEEIPDLAGSFLSASFRAFAQNLLAGPAAPYTITGFSSQEAGEENAFAAYVFKTVEEAKNSGKWNRFGKLGIFGR